MILTPSPPKPVHLSKPTFSKRQLSRLNPIQSLRITTSPNTTNHSHLANLERLLSKPSAPLPVLVHDPGIDPDHRRRRSGGLLSNLNLPSLFPFARDQEMSPRTMTRLYHLLSADSARPSPKNSIAPRWRLYHGSQDWAGLLDHLDENLRRELVRYGDFIHAAYQAFHSHPDIPADAHRSVSLHDRSYRITRSLFATASVRLPDWADKVAPWMTQQSSWIGYVAVCDDEQEIRRMGRRDIAVVLRGTSTCLEWAENFRAGLMHIDEGTGNDEKVECGFLSLFKTPGARVQSLCVGVAEEVRRLVKQYEGEQLSITVTGHSLGAALAVLVADELSAHAVPPIAVFSFGGPRVGNGAFADRVRKRGVKVLRVVNAGDVVTMVPGGVVRSSDGYAHVGSELRVDSKLSPYLRPNPGPACCHDLEAYLHLVDGYMGANSPFRSDAKRSLVRLLHLQGSAVKKLYMSKARDLGLDPV